MEFVAVIEEPVEVWDWETWGSTKPTYTKRSLLLCEFEVKNSP